MSLHGLEFPHIVENDKKNKAPFPGWGGGGFNTGPFFQGESIHWARFFRCGYMLQHRNVVKGGGGAKSSLPRIIGLQLNTWRI